MVAGLSPLSLSAKELTEGGFEPPVAKELTEGGFEPPLSGKRVD